jgi:peptidoglycan hydrolase-like protein with peptidoglycan-binding domain
MVMPKLVMSGHKGIQVLTLQRLLNGLLAPKQGRPPLKHDGNFGSKTERRVKEFQKLCKLDSDGIVGPLTNAKLLDIRLADLKLNMTPASEVKGRAFSIDQTLPFKPTATSVGQAADQPSKMKLSVEAAFGRAVQLPPLDTSPWAINGQLDLYIPNDSVKTEISAGGGFTKNLETSPNKKFTGNVFVQLGATGIKFGKFGPIDLFNPSVIAFAQSNDGQQFVGGFGITNQSSIQVRGNDDSRLGIFWLLNFQTQIWALGLRDGKFRIPTTQVFTGFRGEFVIF